MFYFVHPKIKLVKNPFKIIGAFLKPLDLEKLDKQLSFYFPSKQFTFFALGRIAFEEIIKKYHLRNTHLMMPAFICDTFFPILKKYHIKPIFLDIDLDTFNISHKTIKQKINDEVKAILINHAYGLPNDMLEIKRMLNNLNLAQKPLIIEDLSHSFGAKINEQFVGNFSDVAFGSLYKQFPVIKGGLLIEPQSQTVAQTTSRSKLNKIILNLFSSCLQKLEQDLVKRQSLALFFQKELRQFGFQTQNSENNVFTYLSALTPNALTVKRNQLRQIMQKKGTRLGRVWHKPIILNEQAQKHYQIKPADFPNTIEASQRIINFPLQNDFSKKDIICIAKKLKSALEKIRA